MLQQGANESDTLRVIIQASDDFTRLDCDEDRTEFLSEPGSTQDPRYDALLAGLAVHLATTAGMETTPSWTRDPGRYLGRFWWFGLPDGSSLQAYWYQRTPACMRARGIMFNADELKSL
jgi:hypothetical protein